MKYKNLLVIAGVITAAVVLYGATRGYLTVDTLRTSQDRLLAVVDARPLTSALSYLLLYILVTALSIPGALVLTLAGGALFGLLWGSVLTSIASTVGATVAFLIARFVLRSLVREKFAGRLERVRRGFEADGAFYLFSLRLVPVIPFFVINIVMALTSIRTVTFFLVSQIGMLPATVVYVNAGTQLATVQSASDILSARMILSFALLAAFPWLARGALSLIRRQ